MACYGCSIVAYKKTLIINNNVAANEVINIQNGCKGNFKAKIGDIHVHNLISDFTSNNLTSICYNSGLMVPSGVCRLNSMV